MEAALCSTVKRHRSSTFSFDLNQKIDIDAVFNTMSGCVSNKLAMKSAEITQVEDLLVEIFLRLPLYSIQRFKTACKNWQSLVTNPTFRKLWRKRNLKPPTGLFVQTTPPILVDFVAFPSEKQTTLPYFRTDLKKKIKNSCNGLFLCSTKTKHYVYNPTTDMCHTLPKLGDATSFFSSTLAFDPNLSPHYKVVCVVEPDMKIHVYSSNMRSWKPDTTINYTCARGVYWNGCIHWLYALKYFDIETGTINRMPKPMTSGKWRLNYYFGESCGRLNYAKLWKKGESGNSCSVDVYDMKRDYSEWVLKYHVELAYRFCETCVLSVVHGDEEDDSFLVLKVRQGIVRYNLVSEITEELPFALTGYTDRAFQYIETQYEV